MAERRGEDRKRRIEGTWGPRNAGWKRGEWEEGSGLCTGWSSLSAICRLLDGGRSFVVAISLAKLREIRAGRCWRRFGWSGVELSGRGKIHRAYSILESVAVLKEGA